MKNQLSIIQKQLVFLVFLFLSVPCVQAGENLDSLFIEARQAAMDTSSREQAIEMCKNALSQIPYYHDFRILLGRCYAWDGRYSEAETELVHVVEEMEDYQDARNALLDVYIWSKQDEKALEFLSVSIQKYPGDTAYKIKQFRILSRQDRKDEALHVAEDILKIDPDNKEALTYKQKTTTTKEPYPPAKLSGANVRRASTIRYAHNRLAETKTEWQFIVVEPSLDPWHWMSFEHKEIFPFGPFIIKMNYANRFQNTATQVEMESYPLLRKGTYLYTGIGFSKSDLFPSFRLGLEVFQALANDFEASLGLRYLEVPDKQIPIYVGSLGKYWQSYWISLKSYVSPANSSLSKSWILGVRKYLNNASNHIEVYAGSGVSPDANLGGEEIEFLGSRSFGTILKFQINPLYDLNVGLHFSNLETRSNAFRGDTGLQISFTMNY